MVSPRYVAIAIEGPKGIFFCLQKAIKRSPITQDRIRAKRPFQMPRYKVVMKSILISPPPILSLPSILSITRDKRSMLPAIAIAARKDFPIVFKM